MKAGESGSSGGRLLALALAALSLAVAVGCGAPPAQFSFNRVYAQVQAGLPSPDGGAATETFPAAHAQEITDILYALFGTPDEPYIPQHPELNWEGVLDPDLIPLAAGPVRREAGISQMGLFRQHCVHCHGVSGDAHGPTAPYLNPYPRDYRPGIYKFKSTPVGVKPTHADLKRILIDGIPGTAMPSFVVLPDDEIEALTDYVKYLTIRGQTERALIAYAAAELDPEDPIVSDEVTMSMVIEQFVLPAVESWREAPSEVVAIPKRPEWNTEQRAEAIAAGQRHFYGVGACFTCHGESQLGDGQLGNYDDWTKELVPDNPASVRLLTSLGALEPRTIRPRNLRSGVYRGGRRPIDLFWRLRNGIEGSGMPAAAYRGPDAPHNPAQLSDDNLWELVEYLRSLPYERISDPYLHVPNYQRPRN